MRADVTVTVFSVGEAVVGSYAACHQGLEGPVGFLVSTVVVVGLFILEVCHGGVVVDKRGDSYHIFPVSWDLLPVFFAGVLARDDGGALVEVMEDREPGRLSDARVEEGLVLGSER